MGRNLPEYVNCWIVAMMVWWMTRATCPVGIRRSRPFWFIPHFVATMPGRWRSFYSVEVIPPRRMRWTRNDFVLLFRGKYRVVEYRAIIVRRFNTREEAYSWMGENNGR